MTGEPDRNDPAALTDEELTEVQAMVDADVAYYVSRLIAALRASRAEVERLRGEREELNAFFAKRGVPYRATPLESVEHMAFCADMLVQCVSDLAPPTWKQARACYECGQVVDRDAGEQHGRSGWVHYTCMDDDDPIVSTHGSGIMAASEGSSET